MKKKTATLNKFAEDYTTTSVISKYGDVVRSGSEVLASINSLEVVNLSPALDIALGGGLREGSVVVMTGDPKSGKAGTLDSIVYTPIGPKKMRDIKLGMSVCTPDGGTAIVDGIFPQGKTDTYRVVFDDGTSTECSDDHLWKVRKTHPKVGKDKWQILSIREIINSGLRLSDRFKWAIPMTKEVYFITQSQQLDSWVLGALLGDGGLTEGSPCLTSVDQEILDRFSEYFSKFNLFINKTSANGCSYRISNSNNGVGDIWLTNQLRSLNLFGLNSHEKFIPKQYKYGSVEQRLELIRGLMDTDGFNDKGIRAEYCTVSSDLAKDFAEVVRSLGYRVVIAKRITKCNGKEFPSFRLHISGNNVNCLFSISRKILERTRLKPSITKKIVDIQYVGKKECQCISVDHPDHLYLTDDFNVTHNTTTALHFASKCQAKNKRVIYVNTEGRLSKQNFEGIKGLNPEAILIVESTNDRVLTAEDFLNIIEYYINNDPGCLIIADSLSNMVPSCELEGEVRTGVRNALPRLLSMFFKRISGTLMKNKTILICITHNIANTGGSPYAPSKMADCGNMLQYQAGTNMVITHRGKWQVPKDTGPHVGQIANWSIKTSNAGGRPNSTAESWIRYGVGVDETQEIVQIACEFRLIKSSGAWYTIACAVENTENPIISKILSDNNVNNDPESIEKFFKFQGINNVLEFINNHEELALFIYSKIKELY